LRKHGVTDWQKQLAAWVQKACVLEVMSPKPGNVRPGFEFENASVTDFLSSADAIAPELAVAGNGPLGETILRSIEVTRAVVGHNTNLGIVLLIAPLAAVPEHLALRDGIRQILNSTTVADSRLVYQAIRVAQPAGLGQADDQDLQNEPTMSLTECMELAADRDLIAAQYAHGFPLILQQGMDWLRESESVAKNISDRICWLAVRLLAEFGDSLIARKCGIEMSDRVRNQASNLLEIGWPAANGSNKMFDEFDSFLRQDGNRRNPGTTADVVAAILFAALRDGEIPTIAPIESP
jgi:triphosphoribosyl-dephospho-CoA synthase